MFKSVVEKEIREIICSPKFVVSFAVCTVLILLAFYMGAANYRANRSQYEAAVIENHRQLERVSTWTAIEDNRIFFPPTPMSVLITGVSNDVGRIVEFDRWRKSRPYNSRFGEEPVLAIFRFLDIEFLFGVVLSLFSILLCYDAISGEKEHGILRLVFANSIRRSSYLLGKITGAMLAIGIPLIAAISIGVLILPMLGVPMSAGDWGRLVLIITTGLIYVLFFITTSILVSALTHKSSNSFLILLVIWIITVQLIPRSAVLLAGKVIDMPTLDEIAVQEDRLSLQLNNEFKKKMIAFKPLHKDDEDLASQELFQLIYKLLNERSASVEKLSERLDEDRENKQQLQARLGFSLSRISPAASLTLALSSLAGTDYRLMNNYREQAELYRQGYVAFLKHKIDSIATEVAAKGISEEPKHIDPTELPVFQYSPPSLQQAINVAMPDAGLLLIYCLLVLSGAMIAFNHYDLR